MNIKDKLIEFIKNSPDNELIKLFSEINIPFDYGNIKTFEDACYRLGLDPVNEISINDKPQIKAYKKLEIIIKAINEGWIPDWSDKNQYKYYPYFDLSSGGFRFHDSNYSSAYANSGCGSRLCLQTREKSDYVAKQFIDLYKEFML